MRDYLKTLLTHKSGEGSGITMFLMQSVFLGIFLGSFNITTYTLLLAAYDEQEMARGFILSGISSMLFIFLYRALKSVLTPIKLSRSIYSLCTILAFFSWALVLLNPVGWSYFLVFVLLGPVNILAYMIYPQIPDNISAKREHSLLRLSDASILAGIVFISFVIPLTILAGVQARDTLLIGALSSLVVTFIQFRHVSIPRSEDLTESNTKSENAGKSSLKKVAMFFIFLSVVTSFFILYSTLDVIRVKYPTAGEMTVFLGLYTGLITLVILLVKFLGMPSLMNKYDFQGTLVIPPVILTGFVGITIAIGISFASLPISSAGFMTFFILLLIVRFMSGLLNDSVIGPVSKVLHYSVKEDPRHLVRSGLNPVMYEAAVIISGLLLVGAGLIRDIHRISFLIFLLIISITWIIVAFSLIARYRSSIAEEIKKAESMEPERLVSDQAKEHSSRFYGQMLFRNNYFNLISGDYRLFNQINNKWYFYEIIDNARKANDSNLIPVLNKIASGERMDDLLRQRSAEGIDFFRKLRTAEIDGHDDVRTDLQQLSSPRIPPTAEILKLLRDKSIESKRLAIFMVGKFRLSDLVSLVCDCLDTPALAHDAYEVLRSFGPAIEDQLIRLYVVTSGNLRMSLIILRLLNRTCNSETVGFLFSRLWSNSRAIKEEVVKCLRRCGFKPSDSEKKRLELMISDIIDLIIWVDSARLIMMKNNQSSLAENLEHEIKRWETFLFGLMTITYGSGIVQIIKSHLESHRLESIIYVSQLLDNLVPEEIKSKYVSYQNLNLQASGDLDITPELQLSFNRLPEDIINKDYNEISLWTKACILRSVTELQSDEMAESIIALLFSPEELLREEAARLIAGTRPELYVPVIPRLQANIKLKLDKIIGGHIPPEEFLFEKVVFLSGCFKSISEDNLLPLAQELKFMRGTNGNVPECNEGCLLWIVNEPVSALFVNSDDLDIINLKAQKFNNQPLYCLKLKAVEEYHFQFPDESVEVLNYIDKIGNFKAG